MKNDIFPVDLDKRIITDDKIKIQKGATVYIEAKQLDVIYQDNIKNRMKKLNKIARTLEIPFHGRNKLYKIIRELYPQYMNDITSYRNTYNKLKKACENYTFHHNTANDPYFLNKLLKDGEFVLNDMLHQDNPIPRWEKLDYQLEILLSQIKSYKKDHIKEISLYKEGILEWKYILPQLS